MTHLLEITRSSDNSAHPDEHRFPEHPDERSYHIICADPKHCEGWLGCEEPHEVDGRSAACGPHNCDCPDGQPNCLVDAGPPPWHNQERFEFHGSEHTWRDSWGWTVPYPGCVVASGCTQLPDTVDETPIGIWEVEEDWWDESACQLEFTTAPPTPAHAIR